MNEWYKAKYEADNNLKIEDDYIRKMSEDEYLQYIIEKRKKEIEE